MNKLKQHFYSRRIPLKAIADGIGISTSSVSRKLNNKCDFKAGELVLLSKYMKKPINEILKMLSTDVKAK